jgi:hypothetical protein
MQFALGILRILIIEIYWTTHVLLSLKPCARHLVYASGLRRKERGQSRLVYIICGRDARASWRSYSGSPFLYFVPSSLAVV